MAERSVHEVRRTGRSGQVVVYRYYRSRGVHMRLFAEPGTAEYDAEIAAASAWAKPPDPALDPAVRAHLGQAKVVAKRLKTGEIARFLKFPGRRWPAQRLFEEPGTRGFDLEVARVGGWLPTARQKRGTVYVYFIQDVSTRAVKIGSSLDPPRRLKAFRTAWLHDLEMLGCMPEPLGGSLERTLHRKFKHLRLRGEWYAWAPDLEAYIAQRAQPLPDAPNAKKPPSRS